MTRLRRVVPEADDAACWTRWRECRSRMARKGPRCGLAPVLAVAVCATLAYARSYAAIGKSAADSPTRVREGLRLWSGAVPDPATIWRVRSAADRPGWTRCGRSAGLRRT